MATTSASTKKKSAKSPVAKRAPARKSPARKTTSAAGSRGRAKAAPEATALLEKDHKTVHALFQKYKKLMKAEADGSDRQALAEQICTELTVHAAIEEEIFYPAARAAEVDDDLLDEADVEHASVKSLIAQIRAMGPDEPLYDAKVTVLGEYVDHHVEEEEGEMFRKCRRAKMDLAALGEQLAARKADLMAEAAEEIV